MAAEPRGGGHPTGQHRGQRRLVHLHHPPVDAGQPAAQVGQVAPYSFGERLRQLPPRTVVGQGQVAARPLDRRRQRPGPDDLGLERTLVSLRLLLDLVEVLREQAAGAALIHALRAGQPPSRGLEVEREVGGERDRAAGHGRARIPTRQLGDVRQPDGRRQLPQHEPHRLGVRVCVVAGMGADAGGGGHRGSAEPVGRVVNFVGQVSPRKFRFPRISGETAAPLTP